jgi:hypothetical protein
MPGFAEFASVPAPVGGIDAVTSIMEMNPTDALYAYNVDFTQQGPKVRNGSQQWATAVSGTGGVRTVISVRGAGTAGAQDFLFACTASGIYDCSASTSSPTLVVTFGITSGNAGYCEYDFATNAAGDVLLMVCDEANGYYTFDCSTSTWVKVTAGAGGTQVSGVDPATFVSVRVFGAFIHFVQGGTGLSWLSSTPGAPYGAMSSLGWGNKFAHGGNLNNLYVFTYGSALGTYTYLIGIGDAGDVLAYQGINPFAAATWTLAGEWFVGDLPAGRRSCTNYGGDLAILSAYGIIQISSLFLQKDIEDPTAYLDKKIAPALAADFNLLSALRGFAFVAWPAKNSLIVTEPLVAGVTKKQWVYNLATNAWSVYNGLDFQCGAFWHGNLYVGTSAGTLIKMIGTQDGVLLNGTGGVAINFGLLGAFQQGKHTGVNKIIDLVRAYFLTDVPLSFQTFVRYDFDVSDLALGSVSFISTPASGGWDAGVWDMAIWAGGGTPTPQIAAQGAVGVGKWAAIGILGATKGDTTLLGYDVSMRPTAGFF